MNDTNEYLWLLKTNKGDFFITVLGDWSLAEAAKKVRLVFKAIKLDITAMIPRKRVTGPDETPSTIYQDAEEPMGFVFMGGKSLWDACGRGSEFEAELIRLLKE